MAPILYAWKRSSHQGATEYTGITDTVIRTTTSSSGQMPRPSRLSPKPPRRTPRGGLGVGLAKDMSPCSDETTLDSAPPTAGESGSEPDCRHITSVGDSLELRSAPSPSHPAHRGTAQTFRTATASTAEQQIRIPMAPSAALPLHPRSASAVRLEAREATGVENDPVMKVFIIVIVLGFVLLASAVYCCGSMKHEGRRVFSRRPARGLRARLGPQRTRPVRRRRMELESESEGESETERGGNGRGVRGSAWGGRIGTGLDGGGETDQEFGPNPDTIIPVRTPPPPYTERPTAGEESTVAMGRARMTANGLVVGADADASATTNIAVLPRRPERVLRMA
ncbi:hypothetical protein MKZ38_009923 [Zalerion maritima]|uniref:Uncharacterized protein n=1 Tax=Zalerion maritima TaxID=339359 RepID=A0AAD5WUG6_9PEZI|nr:hypothetical protein MKZ38_009923 [Zalerion maritima]